MLSHRAPRPADSLASHFDRSLGPHSNCYSIAVSAVAAAEWLFAIALSAVVALIGH